MLIIDTPLSAVNIHTTVAPRSVDKAWIGNYAAEVFVKQAHLGNTQNKNMVNQLYLFVALRFFVGINFFHIEIIIVCRGSRCRCRATIKIQAR